MRLTSSSFFHFAKDFDTIKAILIDAMLAPFLNWTMKIRNRIALHKNWNRRIRLRKLCRHLVVRSTRTIPHSKCKPLLR